MERATSTGAERAVVDDVPKKEKSHPGGLSSSSDREGQYVYGDDDGVTPSSGEVGLAGLPWELQLEVCGWLSPSQLCSLGQSNRAMREVANDPSVWRSLCQGKFNVARTSPAITAGKNSAKFAFPQWNEWKRSYYLWNRMEKGWRKAPLLEEIKCSHSITSLWVDMRKMWALCGSEITAIDADTKERVSYKVPIVEGKGQIGSVNRGRSSEKYRLVVATGNEKLILWDLDTKEVKDTIQTGLKFSIMDICLQDKTLYFAGGDKLIAVIDIVTGQRVIDNIVSGHTTDIRSLSVDGDTLATGGGYSDNTVKIWDLRTPKVPVFEIKSFKSGIWTMHMSETRLACGSYNQACMFDTRTWQSIWDDPSAHANHINYIEFDDVKLITGSGDRTVKAWDVQTFENWWSVDLGNMVWFASYEDDILATYSSSTDAFTRLHFDA